MTPTFEDQQCCDCGIPFRVPTGYTDLRRRDGKQFFCPNGHGMTYGESELDRFRRERDQLKQDAARLEDNIRFYREARDVADRRAGAARGQITKLKKRAQAGICPCCNRQFVQLARHMQTKHPDFDPVAEVVETNVVPLRA